MYTIKKTFEIAGSHHLQLSYDSPCSRVHGHNWIITVICQSEDLDENGMIIDFAEIKSIVHGKLDHRCFNDVLPFNSTAENIAKWICEQIPKCIKVEVKESENNEASYEV